jgi:hypothetical protein
MKPKLKVEAPAVMAGASSNADISDLLGHIAGTHALR